MLALNMTDQKGGSHGEPRCEAVHATALSFPGRGPVPAPRTQVSLRTLRAAAEAKDLAATTAAAEKLFDTW
jgi:hypothetical protein